LTLSKALTKEKEHEYSVYVEKIERDLESELLKGLEFIGWKERVKRDSTVFLKPNFTFPVYREGITTSPLLLRALLKILRNRTSNVIVGESDGGNHSFTAEQSFKGHGMYEICREMGVELVNLSKLPSKHVSSKIQTKKVTVQLPTLLLQKVDCLISVPVMKVHVMTKVTLSIKNLWGCYPDTMRCLHHKNLDHKLAQIAKILDPKIVVLDGTYMLDLHGPMFGTPVKRDLLLISNNCVAADSLTALIMGVQPEQVGHIKLAEMEKLGVTNPELIHVNKDWRMFKQKPVMLRKTMIDKLSALPFRSELVARTLFDSPLTPILYGAASFMRTPEENEVRNELRKQKP
jgi:uncharacterized protein (DUF362 family)